MGILTGLMLGVIAIELAALLLFSSRSTAVLDQIACLLARKPETLHPGYLELGNFCVWRYRQAKSSESRHNSSRWPAARSTFCTRSVP